MKNNYKYVLSVSVIILTFVIAGFIINHYNLARVCLFSEVHAVVTLNGKPVQGVEVIRTVNWANKDKIYTDTTTTNEYGRFHFEPLYANSISKYSMSTPVVAQKILIKYQSKERVGWKTSLRSYDEYSELDNRKPITLTCELSKNPVIRDQNKKLPIYGICQW